MPPTQYSSTSGPQPAQRRPGSPRLPALRLAKVQDRLILIFEEMPEKHPMPSDLLLDSLRQHRGQVVVEVGLLDSLNSIAVAWLYQIVQAGRHAAGFTLNRANASVRGQARTYGLENFYRLGDEG
jgi:hypothetical protein